jgi:two-component system sensor histidine kinase VanS
MDLQVEEAAEVETDAEKLTIVMRNLLGNAVAYCDAGTAVRVTVSDGAAGVELSVENKTNAINESDLGAMFGGFWRKDSARAGTSHSGLGLSIVAALCELLNVGLTPELSDGNTFRMKLSFHAEDRA